MKVQDVGRFFPILVLCLSLFSLSAVASETPASDVLHILSPNDGETVENFLTAVLHWKYPINGALEIVDTKDTYGVRGLVPWRDISLEISRQPDFSDRLIQCDLKDEVTEYRFAVLPSTTYYWRITPFEIKEGKRVELTAASASARFTTGAPLNRVGASDEERYRNPRRGAHWMNMNPVQGTVEEPLSPWYDIKAYRKSPPPTLAQVRDLFPVPVWEGPGTSHQDALDAYWYCWDTLLRVWTYPPVTDHHQAVSNLIGYRTWGWWGSTMIFDTCFIMHFARYGYHAYPFISALDNAYARQHENGYICRESDNDNREVAFAFPVNPPVLAWAEWENYRVTGDKERLRAVFLPLARHYEWWMTYQRRENGLYWTSGLNEADDSPRNGVMHSAVSATSYQGVAAQCLAKMAGELGREDMKAFFEDQNEELKQLVNRFFWDEEHHIYNDLDKDGRPITELTPGALCKHVHMFWPLMAGFASSERAADMLKEIKNPASFNRLTGIPSLSADSAGYNTENGQYWRGAVWPPTQCMVQEGLRQAGYADDVYELAEKYHRACVADYQAHKTLCEDLAPDKILGCGQPDFVGWAGIGPVANLIEYVLGFDFDAPARTITWTIRQAERHGLANVWFNGFKVNLIADPAAVNSPRMVSVESGGAFTLRIKTSGKTIEEKITAGARTIEVPAQ